MNQLESDCFADDFETEDELAQRAALAIKCRKIRLWLAAHPGSRAFEIGRGTSYLRVYHALKKMWGMGIIAPASEVSENGRITKWYVVPQ